MNRTLAAASVATLALVFAACSPESPDTKEVPAATSSATVTPTPSPTPTEVTLSTDDAANRYLALVCDNNAASRKLSEAYEVSYDEFANGGTPDPADVKAAAARMLEYNRMAIALIDDDYFVWPDEVADILPHVRDSFLGALSTLDTITNADSYAVAYYAEWPDPSPEQETAAQEIRYALGLSADTTASCDGHTGQLQGLYDELVKRTEAADS